MRKLSNVFVQTFLFLVALGIDYNMFLMTRVKEESELLVGGKPVGIRGGMINALGATGGVITSAGVLLAAVFAVLGVLPLITLTQIGVIVCVGVLLDTLLVRTVVVPSLTFLVGALMRAPVGEAIPIYGYGDVFRWLSLAGVVAIVFVLAEWWRASRVAPVAPAEPGHTGKTA